jgi:hypothetical protein
MGCAGGRGKIGRGLYFLVSRKGKVLHNCFAIVYNEFSEAYLMIFCIVLMNFI